MTPRAGARSPLVEAYGKLCDKKLRIFCDIRTNTGCRPEDIRILDKATLHKGEVKKYRAFIQNPLLPKPLSVHICLLQYNLHYTYISMSNTYAEKFTLNYKDISGEWQSEMTHLRLMAQSQPAHFIRSHGGPRAPFPLDI